MAARGPNRRRAGHRPAWQASAPLCLAWLLVHGSAQAQRANENVLRSAEDAFGTSIGRESIGLYSPFSVRGFSPIAAGNVRIDGLYFDAVVIPNARLIRGSTVRVGISAQGYPFTAPTGIADYRLRLPGDEPALSVAAGVVSNGTTIAEADLQLPLSGDGLAAGIGLAASDDHFFTGGSAHHSGAAALLRWRPTPDIEIVPFWSRSIHRDEDAIPRIIVAGDFVPARIERGTFFSQRWARFEADDTNYGAIARYASPGLTIAGGIFRSIYAPARSYSDLFLSTSREGLAARHVIVSTPAQRTASTSGELRLSRQFTEGPRRHTVHLSARAREQRRLYGGSVSTDYGPARIGEEFFIPPPTAGTGPLSRDHIRQHWAGIAYEGTWRDVGELTLGILRTDYRKETDRPGQVVPETAVQPWLFNGALAIHLSPRLALYGGYTRGLEESGAAPDIAVNRNEASPALRTMQYDGGLRWSIAQNLRLVAGFFNVEKPYFNLDAARVYRQLGEVRHRGLELSLVGEPVARLHILAGGVLLDARVTGEAVSAGVVGKRPVGTPSHSVLLNAEYRPPFLDGWAFDIGLHMAGRRAANAANSFFAEPSKFVTAGFRYGWNMGGAPMSLRFQVANVLNNYEWHLQGSNAFMYNAPRHYAIRIAADL